MSSKKLLSIVVPTKDRYKYLKYLIELIAGLNSDEIELVIQDNSDDNKDFLVYLDKLNYSFIIYNHTSGQIPMSVNSDKAVLNSTGEYICFLGDDDGVTQRIVEGVHWMKENGVEAVKPVVPSYYWPDAKEGRDINQSATIFYKKYDGKVRYLSAYDELIKVLKAGIPDRGDLPLAYHAIVSREAMDRIYNKCGTYFPGNSPDIANAVALSLVVKKYAIVNSPWTISGKCVFGGGGVSAPGKKYPPDISDMSWFLPDAEKHWDKLIPRIAVGETIWPESAISALKKMGREDLLEIINLKKLYSYFAFKRPTLIYLLNDINVNIETIKFDVFKLNIFKYTSALQRRISWLLNIGRPLQISNVQNIIEAAGELSKFN